MKNMTYNQLSFTLTLISAIFVSCLVKAEDKIDVFHQDTSVSKDWMMQVLPYFGICTLTNTTWIHATMETSKTELEKMAEMMLAKSVYEGRTAIEFSYTPAEQSYSVYLISKELNLLEGRYKVSLRFDSGVSQEITGYVSKESAPKDGIFGENYKNMIFFRHKDFLREVVPKMKQFNGLDISVKGNNIPLVSLSGFTRAFSWMENCMGSAVTYNLVDPF